MKYMLPLLCVAMFILCVVIMLNPTNEITKVELARSGAWSDRGAAISVDKSLNYNFYYTYLGRGDKPMSGYYTGYVSKQFWDTLTKKLERIDLINIPERDNLGGSDMPYFELIVKWKTGKKRIIRMENFNSTDSLSKMINWLNVSYKNVSFIKESKLPLKFETTYQSGGFEKDQMKNTGTY